MILLQGRRLSGLTEHLEQAAEEVKELDWKIFDVTIMPVVKFAEEQDNAG